MSFNALTSWNVPAKSGRKQSLKVSILYSLMSHSLVYADIMVISMLEGTKINVKTTLPDKPTKYLKLWIFFLTYHYTSDRNACYFYYFTLKAEEQVWKCWSISTSLLGILQYRMFSQSSTFWNYINRFPGRKKTLKSESQKLKTKEGQGELSHCFIIFIYFKAFTVISFSAYSDDNDIES